MNILTCADEYLAESGDAEEDLALLQDMPSLPRLPWKLPCREFDSGPGEAGDAVNGDFDLTESVLDLKVDQLSRCTEEHSAPFSGHSECAMRPQASLLKLFCAKSDHTVIGFALDVLTRIPCNSAAPHSTVKS